LRNLHDARERQYTRRHMDASSDAAVPAAAPRPIDLRSVLTGACVLAPMTKGSNLPYRRLCVEQGARVTMSEMTVARRLKQRRRGEFALIRRAPQEPFFGVQLAGNDPEEMGWAAELVEARGADLVDINLGCPIDHFTRKGLGAALGRQPARVRRIVEAMKLRVRHIPVTVKIRLGWTDKERNHLDMAAAAVDGGADAIFVHGRTRQARYTMAADWDAIGEVAAAVAVPVVGNGDLLFPRDIAAALARSGCAGVMIARGALIKPWVFREAAAGYDAISAEDRLNIYRRYVELARAHWGDDEYATVRIREFLLWHLGFWCRYAPRREDGTYPSMQERQPLDRPAPLDALLARNDELAHAYLADALLAGTPVDPAAPAPAAARRVDDDAAEAG
jgi:tRNA-dihydrouridine synthase 3